MQNQHGDVSIPTRWNIVIAVHTMDLERYLRSCSRDNVGNYMEFRSSEYNRAGSAVNLTGGSTCSSGCSSCALDVYEPHLEGRSHHNNRPIFSHGTSQARTHEGIEHL